MIALLRRFRARSRRSGRGVLQQRILGVVLLHGIEVCLALDQVLPLATRVLRTYRLRSRCIALIGTDGGIVSRARLKRNDGDGRL